MREPFPEWAWPEVWAWIGGLREKLIDDFGPRTMDEWMAFVEENVHRQRTWGVWMGGELGGVITFDKGSPMAGAVHLYFKRSMWGRAPMPAMRQVLELIFAGPTTKILTSVFEDNHAARGMFRKLGFLVEGHFRSQTVRGGKPVAMVAVGLTKEDFYRVHDGAGRPGGVSGKHAGSENGDERVESDIHAGADERSERIRVGHRGGADQSE
ncbi:MAG TPA: GNAT family protein [Bryobacteraceae bacterium]|nr:GNAT family protein [Bryobacteraceae bacterium]